MDNNKNNGLIQPYKLEPETDSEEEEQIVYRSIYQKEC